MGTAGCMGGGGGGGGGWTGLCVLGDGGGVGLLNLSGLLLLRGDGLCKENTGTIGQFGLSVQVQQSQSRG